MKNRTNNHLMLILTILIILSSVTAVQAQEQPSRLDDILSRFDNIILKIKDFFSTLSPGTIYGGNGCYADYGWRAGRGAAVIYNSAGVEIGWVDPTTVDSVGAYMQNLDPPWARTGVCTPIATPTPTPTPVPTPVPTQIIVLPPPTATPTATATPVPTPHPTHTPDPIHTYPPPVVTTYPPEPTATATTITPTGTYVQKPHCPPGTYFNPEQGICVQPQDKNLTYYIAGFFVLLLIGLFYFKREK